MGTGSSMTTERTMTHTPMCEPLEDLKTRAIFSEDHLGVVWRRIYCRRWRANAGRPARKLQE